MAEAAGLVPVMVQKSIAGAQGDMADFRPRATPRNRAVAVLGDSIASHNSNTTAPNSRYMAYGSLTWAGYFTGQRFTFSATDNYGIPGQNSSEILPRVEGMLTATGAGTILFDFLTNDAAQISYDASVVNYTAAIQKCRDSDRIVVCIVPRPRDRTASGLTMSAAQLLNLFRLRRFVLGLHDPARGIYVVDPAPNIADPTSANGALLATMTYDGLHPDQFGAYWAGRALEPVFNQLFPPLQVLPVGSADLYNATDNPVGALNNNPMMIGGTTNATNYAVISAGSGLTATLSKTASGNKIWQQVVMSGTAGSGAISYPVGQNPVPAGNLTIGDVVEAVCDFEIDAGLTGISGLGLAIVDNTSFARAMTFDSTTDINARPLPNLAHAGVMRTPRFTLTSTGIRLAIAMTAINGAAVAATFRVGAMALRKVS